MEERNRLLHSTDDVCGVENVGMRSRCTQAAACVLVALGLLCEAEKATRIHKDFLERLESDDHSAMPEPIYVRGFVKAYANYLGLDGDRFAAQIAFWRKDGGEPDAPPLGELGTGSYELIGLAAGCRHPSGFAWRIVFVDVLAG
jgi:Helix-turn-helix domain